MTNDDLTTLTKLTVVLLYPPSLGEDFSVYVCQTEEDAPRSAVRFARMEALRGLTPAERKGLKLTDFRALLVFDGHPKVLCYDFQLNP